MDLEYEHQLFNIENNVQDKDSLAWKKLCEYVEKVAEEGGEEFSPFEYLGQDLYFQIYTLPENISKLNKVKKIGLYGSRLKRIPPEIGQIEALEYFDPYTSYNLHWFPYEIINCKNLKDSRISTRALYGNYKYRRPFPDLRNNPVRYDNKLLKCSICKSEITYEKTNQVWVSLLVGTDVIPLLANLCSKECEEKLPQPPKAYIQYPHKGGKDLKQPLNEDELWEIEFAKRQKEMADTKNKNPEKKLNLKKFPTLKLIRKLWDKRDDQTKVYNQLNLTLVLFIPNGLF